jgi:hypothetical protein
MASSLGAMASRARPRRSSLSASGGDAEDNRTMTRRVPTRWGLPAGGPRRRGSRPGRRCRRGWRTRWGDAYGGGLAGRLVCRSSNGPRGYVAGRHPLHWGVTNPTLIIGEGRPSNTARRLNRAQAAGAGLGAWRPQSRAHPHPHTARRPHRTPHAAACSAVGSRRRPRGAPRAAPRCCGLGPR